MPGLPLPPAAEPGPPPPAAPSPLIGTWRGVNTAFLPSHLQTTTWHFSPDGSCLQTFLTIADGVELTSTRACTWTADAATVTITYAGAAGPVTFTLRYSFPASDRLRLDANEYARVD
ncbi:MAG TPA: hypothetical protein VFU46_08090 [Gemmatimonadales bacterium]|nr:hypothetical protein [Gemmatimonadales bacterium]